MSEDPGMVVSNGRVIHLAPRCLRCGCATVSGEDVCATCKWELKRGGHDD